MIDQISTVIAALSLIALAFQVAYSRWEWLYLTVNRLRYALFNPSSRWDLTVEYGGSFQRSQVEAMANELRSRWPRFRRIADRPTSLTIQLDGMVVDILLHDEVAAVGPEPTFMSITVSFKDVRSTYRESQQLLERLGSLIEQLTRSLHPSRMKFGARIRFPGNNPYFGLYVKRLRPASIESFHCVFRPLEEDEDYQSTVTISKEAVALASSNSTRWIALSKRYLAVR